MSYYTRKGNWGDRYIIEPKPNTKVITCHFCRNYDHDGSCRVKPIVISQVGYDYWKYCKMFYLSNNYNTPRKRAYVEQHKKVRSIPMNQGNIKDTLEKVTPNITAHKYEKVVELGSTVVLYDLSHDEEFLYEMVLANQADTRKGKVSITSAMGRWILGAKEGELRKIETAQGVSAYRVLKIIPPDKV